MGLVGGVRVVGFLSILLGIAVVGVSGWLFKTTYDHRETLQGKTEQAISEVGDFFSRTVGSNTNKIDADFKNRLLIGITSTTLAAGGLQLITSIFLLFCSSSKGGRVSARLWLFVNLFVILACAGSCVCLLRLQYFQDEIKDGDSNHQLKAYVGANAADALFIFIFSFVTAAFGCRSE